MIVRVGARGSVLALTQARLVTEHLDRIGLQTEVTVIRTQGDRDPLQPTSTLGIGAFVKDLEAALLDGRIHLAVHSAKDLPSASSPGLALSAFLPREDPRDVIVTRDGTGVAGLRAGAVIGTESPRRRAFLLAARPDVTVVSVRGNVDTRLRKLAAGEVDALLLAAAGLARLGLRDRVSEWFDPAIMLPAVGQGAIVAQTRDDAWELREQLDRIDHAATRAAVEAERALLTALGGGCQRPIAALGVCEGERLRLEGAVLDPDGTRIVRDQVEGEAARPSVAGEELAARLLAMGAHDLLFEVAS